MSEMMVRKQIYLPRKQNLLLKRLAKQRGVSEAEVIRQALEQQTTGPSTLPVRDNSAWQAVMKFVKTRQALEVTGQPARWKREELYAERENRWVREVKDAPDTD